MIIVIELGLCVIFNNNEINRMDLEIKIRVFLTTYFYFMNVFFPDFSLIISSKLPLLNDKILLFLLELQVSNIKFYHIYMWLSKIYEAIYAFAKYFYKL